MADDAASSGASCSTGKDGDDPESTIEINIKTLDSQVHKLRVNKNDPVLDLKEKILDATGIPVDQQRLIFRGRILKDDHLLSEYHMENGYTLHLVARRSAEGQHSSGSSEENAHANVAENGEMRGDMSGDFLEEAMDDIIGSLGLGMPGGMATSAFLVPLTTAPEGVNNMSGRLQLQPPGAIPPNMIIPDSLMTLMEYIDRMDQVLQNNGVPSVGSNAQQSPRTDSAYLNQSFPSAEVLVSVVERAQQLLGGSASSALSHLAQRIQRDAASNDSSVRSQIQNESAQLGIAMQHLGAMLLELGRTMMMLRMGPSPADAFVNSGSAVYINPTGPNPIMVQPSFQSVPSFGVSAIPILTGLSGIFGGVDPSQTPGGAPATSGPSVGTTTASGGAVNEDHGNGETAQGGNPSANSTRRLRTRTVVVLPFQVRRQEAVPNQSTVSQGSETEVNNVSQPNSTFAVRQASPGGLFARISTMVAQINAHIANALAANPPNQVSSSVSSTANQGPRPSTNNVAGTLSSVASGNTQLQNELPGSNDGETSLNEQSNVTGTAENSDENNKPSDGVTAESITPSASDRSEPLGLGGCLEPKRRSRTAKPSGTSDDSGEALDTSSVSGSQNSVSVGQEVLESFDSKNTDVSSGSVKDSQTPSLTPQFADGMPPRRPGGEEQANISSMLSREISNPAFGNMVSNVAAQTGIGSPDHLMNMLEQCTQCPAILDAVSSIVQNFDEPGTGQGDFDLSRIVQQLMPAVSQFLGGAAVRPTGTNGGESSSQPRHSDEGVGDTSERRSSQINLQQACQHIEQSDSPEDILGAILEAAAQAYGEDDESIQDYLKLLLQQVRDRERVESESEAKNQP